MTSLRKWCVCVATIALASLLTMGCGDNNNNQPTRRDVGVDVGVDVGDVGAGDIGVSDIGVGDVGVGDVGPDTGCPRCDVGQDAPTAQDTGVDIGADTGVDAAADVGPDTGM